MTFLETLQKYWTVFTGIGMTLMYLGALHQMVKANNRAISGLFKKYEDLHDFKIAQATINKTQDDKFGIVVQEIRTHTIESSNRYTALSVRIDDLFKLLGKRKDD